jgi:hypothetical protein
MADIQVYQVGSIKDGAGNNLACGAQVITCGDLTITVAANTLSITKCGVTTTYTPGGTGISADAGQVLTLGTDGKAYLNCEAVQDCIGQAIAAGVGITYDDALNAINGYLASFAVTDTNTVDLTISGAPNAVLSADVRIDPAATNAITQSANGLAVTKLNRLLACDGVTVLGYLVA